MLLALVLLVLFFAARQAFAVVPDSVSPGHPSRGAMWFRDHGDGGYQEAPQLDTAVDMDVAGMLGRVRVTQRFRNPGGHWVEGIYTFPLPETAAVDHLWMRIGERRIEGQIQERQQARQTYEKAKRAGQRTALVESQRPNIFTTSVGNIGPQETVTVIIEYQQRVEYRDGSFSLRFPLVVAPRYIPGTPRPVAATPLTTTASGWALPTDQVPDADRITPPVQPPGVPPTNPVSIHIDLNSGLALRQVVSLYHAVTTEKAGQGHYRIDLANRTVPADRDFVLQWRPVAAAQPQAAYFYQRQADQIYGALMIMPPQLPAAAEQGQAREAVFVIDHSGSMFGPSMQQAKAALDLALDRLAPTDTFNIVAFNHAAQRLFATARPATAQYLAQAKHYVASLTADGGTEMRAALELALADRDADRRRLRQVVFITDGAVGNEAALFSYIHGHLGSSRLFTVGIGSAPNGYFMRKAARAGRGTFTYIGATDEVQAKIGLLLEKLSHPAVTDLHLSLPDGNSVAVLPDPIPDLYQGEPAMLVFAGKAVPEQLELSGRTGGRPWQRRLNLAQGVQSRAVAVLWARRKVEGLLEQYREARDGDARDALRRRIVRTALDRNIVTRFTSLVAVDVTPVRPVGAGLQSQAVKTNLPQGWDHAYVFGVPQTATPSYLYLWSGLAVLMAAIMLCYRRPARDDV